jgi:hypothetical protein
MSGRKREGDEAMESAARNKIVTVLEGRSEMTIATVRRTAIRRRRRCAPSTTYDKAKGLLLETIH